MTIDFNIILLWLIRLGYLLNILVCFTSSTCKPNIQKNDETFKNCLTYWIISIFMMFIGIISLFNLHINLTGFLREYAHKEGWYQDRRQYQLLLLLGVISFGLIINLKYKSILSGISNNNRRLFYGITFLASVLLIDFISFHPVDQLFKNDIFGCNIRLILELVGIIWVAITLLMKKNQSPKRPFSSHENRKIRFV